MVTHSSILVNERNALIDAIHEQECYVHRYTAGLRLFIERYNEVVHQLEQLEQEDIAREREREQERQANLYPTPPGQVQSPFPYRKDPDYQGTDIEDFDESEYLLPEGLDPAYIYKWVSDSDDDEDEYESDEECVNDHLQERMCVRRNCHQFGFCREHELSAVCICNGSQ